MTYRDGAPEQTHGNPLLRDTCALGYFHDSCSTPKSNMPKQVDLGPAQATPKSEFMPSSTKLYSKPRPDSRFPSPRFQSGEFQIVYGFPSLLPRIRSSPWLSRLLEAELPEFCPPARPLLDRPTNSAPLLLSFPVLSSPLLSSLRFSPLLISSLLSPLSLLVPSPVLS